MTIQVALMNGRGLAMASDRHVYRRDDARSTGRDAKIVPLRGAVPAALMHAGSLTVLGAPTARLALHLERGLAAAAEGGGPEALAEAALATFGGTVARSASGEGSDDAVLMARVARELLGEAEQCPGGIQAGLETFIAAGRQSGPFLDVDRDNAEAAALDRWQAAAAEIGGLLRLGTMGDALALYPELCARAVALALSRACRIVPHASLMLGACCPRSGVPTLVAVDAWSGLGNRLLLRSRLQGRYVAAWQAGRTLITAQGSGADMVHALFDGIGRENWGRLDDRNKKRQHGLMNERWQRAHASMEVCSTPELASVATGLVRSAEVTGFLLGRDEGSVDAVDCTLLTPGGVASYVNDALAPSSRIS